MRDKIYVFAFAILLVVFAGSFEQVLACSCIPTAPCESFGSSDVVFVGKVVGAKYQTTVDDYETVDVGTANERSVSKKVTYDVGEIYFEVIEAFQGIETGSRVTINSGTGGGDCGYWFKRGETYAVFANRENSTESSGISSLTYNGAGNQLKPDANRLWTTICSGTREIKNAEETLEYLRNLPEAGSGGTIIGRIDESIKDYSSENLRGKPFVNAQIKAQQVDGNKQTYYGTSNERGYYEIKVPPGNYLVIPVLKSNLIFENSYYSENEQIKIEDRKCGSKIFWVTNNSEISGKVVDAKGEIVSGISLDLIPADKDRKEKGFDHKFAHVSEDGIFFFAGIPLGRYQISLNYKDKPEDDSPYPTYFYPTTSERNKAKVFEIGLGSKFSDLVFQMPPKLVKRKITGTVEWKNGKPAVGAEIQLIDVEFERNAFFKKPTTNGKGEFSMEWFEGREYRIEVTVWKKSPNGEGSYGIADAETSNFTLNDKTQSFKIVLNLINPDEKSITRSTVRSN